MEEKPFIESWEAEAMLEDTKFKPRQRKLHLALREIIRLNEVIEEMRKDNLIQRATIDIYELRHADNPECE